MENRRRTLRSYIVVFIIIAIIASVVAVFRANQEPKADTVAIPGHTNPVSQFNEDGSHKLLNQWINKKYEAYRHVETQHHIKNDTVFVTTVFDTDNIQKEARGIFTAQGKVIEVNID